MATGSPCGVITVTVIMLPRRSLNVTWATSFSQLQTGEKSLSTCVLLIGLFSSFSPSVIANAAAVPPSRPSTSRIERRRATGAEILG